jgi:hypothetical protein
MSAGTAPPEPLHFDVLLRGNPELLRDWLDRARWGSIAFSAAVIFVGAGLYGAAMGCWRAALQAVFVAVKLPLIIVLTTAGNALLNAMLAPLLGLNITFRQSFLAILMSFTIACAILGSFSPLAAYLVWTSPPMTTDAVLSSGTYSFIQVMHVAIIAFAGVVANLHLMKMLRQMSGTAAIARRVMVAWLAGNLFLGSQLAWILRPFIGSPGLPVEFLRATAFKGNFYETVFGAAARLFQFD